MKEKNTGFPLMPTVSNFRMMGIHEGKGDGKNDCYYVGSRFGSSRGNLGFTGVIAFRLCKATTFRGNSPGDCCVDSEVSEATREPVRETASLRMLTPCGRRRK